MEKDIVPELLENLLKEFEESLQKNEEIKKALEILISKKANYRNANEFAAVSYTHLTLPTKLEV